LIDLEKVAGLKQLQLMAVFEGRERKKGRTEGVGGEEEKANVPYEILV